MSTFKKKNWAVCRGTALIVSMIFIAIFSSLALAMFTMSSTNVRIADNHRKGNRALTSALSGLEVVRYLLSPVYMPGIITASDRFSYLAGFVQNDEGGSGLSNITITSDEEGTPVAINMENVTLYSLTGQSFSATIQPTADIDILQVDIAGWAGAVGRNIRVNYNFGTRAHNVFDYGVATRSPLNLEGNIEMNGANVALDAGVYIETDVDPALSIIGNSQIAGDVSLTNSSAASDIVEMQGGQASIGGETGEAALNHVDTGVPPTEFPVPLPGYFEQYVTGQTIDSDTDTSIDATYENVRIAAGTNPVFSGNTTLRGIVFIETPNVVTFSGNMVITGIIVGNGDLQDNSAQNVINFAGTVNSFPVTELPGESQFDGLRDETGTFLLAPGFAALFQGDFGTLNGAIAANGIEFSGNAGGTIDGSVINYSPTPMTLSGNSDLYFNRSGVDEVPAGFGPEIILYYDAGTYNEVVL